MLVEERFQLNGLKVLAKQGFAFADDIEIHQREVDLCKAELLAHQPAIHLDLGPVQLPVVGRLGVQVAAIGFHFFQAIGVRVVTVRPAPHLELQVLALQCHFVLVMLAAARGHGTMTGNAFLGTGRRGKAQVKVANLGGELTQRPHGHAVAQAGCSAQRT